MTASLLVAVLLAASPVNGTYTAEVQRWRAEQAKSLTADDGWLTLAGLFWLRDGANTAGTNENSNIVLPAGSAPAKVGVFDFHGGVTVFYAAHGVRALVNGKPAASGQLKSDSDGAPDLIHLGRITMMVIHRGKRYAVRVKDNRNPARLNFTGLHWYPVKAQYRVVADFHPYPQPRTISISNILGETEDEPSPGYASFSLGGVQLRLTAVVDEGKLFFIFRDRTSGRMTYGAGRFLTADMPQGGKAILDFNEAYNPPCAFTPYATCPLPPPANRLAVAIEAGEMKYGNH